MPIVRNKRKAALQMLILGAGGLQIRQSRTAGFVSPARSVGFAIRPHRVSGFLIRKTIMCQWREHSRRMKQHCKCSYSVLADCKSARAMQIRQSHANPPEPCKSARAVQIRQSRANPLEPCKSARAAAMFSQKNMF